MALAFELLVHNCDVKSYVIARFASLFPKTAAENVVISQHVFFVLYAVWMMVEKRTS